MNSDYENFKSLYLEPSEANKRHMMKRGKAFLKLDPSFLKGISKWYKTGLDGMVQFLIIFQHIAKAGFL